MTRKSGRSPASDRILWKDLPGGGKGKSRSTCAAPWVRARGLRHPCFPILPWIKRDDGLLEADVDLLGTAFFLNGVGLFMTARHLFAPETATERCIMILRGLRYVRAPVVEVALHPEFDIAIGLAGVPAGCPIPFLRAGAQDLAVGESVVSFGYSRTEVKVFPDDAHPGQALALNFRPRFYQGRIEAHHSERLGLCRGPSYQHTIDEPGGLSGAPLIRPADSAVYGVFSSSMEGAYGISADIGSVLDWPIGFLQGNTLRSIGVVAA